MTANEDLVERWHDWTDQITTEVHRMYHHRRMWRGVNEIVGSSGRSPFFLTAFTSMYVDSQVMAVRRQGDNDGSVVTLRRLMRSIRGNPQAISRTSFRSLWSQLTEPDGDPYGHFSVWADEGFDSFAGEGNEFVDPLVIDADVDLLSQTSAAVREWADQRVAHRDRKEPVAPTFNQLHAAVDVVGELMDKYRFLLTASHFAFMTPTLQAPWWDVFEQGLDIPDSVIERDTRPD